MCCNLIIYRIDYYPRHAPKNFLFRGNMPISNGTFAYDDIVETMETIAKKKNLTMPGNFSLLDVRLADSQCKHHS